MQLCEISEIQKQQYNRFVLENKNASFLQSWEWGQWQEKLGRETARFFLNNDSGQTICSLQLVKMPLPLGQYYLYAPYGPVSDLRFKIEDLRILIQELRKKFPDALFLRIEPRDKINFQSLNLSIFKSVNIQPGITLTVDLSLAPDELLAKMHPKTRYNIKVAQRHNIEVQSELVVTPQYGLYVEEVINLILQTQSRQNYRGHNKNYYRQFVDFFALNNHTNDLQITIYKALYQRQLLACGIMADFGKTRVYLFGGSSEQNKNLMAPYLMHWQAMLDSKAGGMSVYDLGGSEVSAGGERGFTRFKQGFGGKVVEYAGAYDAVFIPSRYLVYKILRRIRRLI